MTIVVLKKTPDDDGPRVLGAMNSGWRATAVVALFALLAGACVGGGRGTAWGQGAFASNGERIYFTGTSERSGEIEYSGGVDPGGMMMAGPLSCASCHGTDARGGTHTMHMQVMDAPNIRWVALSGHDNGHVEAEGRSEAEHPEEAGYDLDSLRLAVVDGRHSDGRSLSEDMPRWEMAETDLADLAEYLQSFEVP